MGEGARKRCDYLLLSLTCVYDRDLTESDCYCQSAAMRSGGSESSMFAMQAEEGSS